MKPTLIVNMPTIVPFGSMAGTSVSEKTSSLSGPVDKPDGYDAGDVIGSLNVQYASQEWYLFLARTDLNPRRNENNDEFPTIWVESKAKEYMGRFRMDVTLSPVPTVEVLYNDKWYEIPTRLWLN